MTVVVKDHLDFHPDSLGIKVQPSGKISPGDALLSITVEAWHCGSLFHAGS